MTKQELADVIKVLKALNKLWPDMTPQEVLAKFSEMLKSLTKIK